MQATLDHFTRQYIETLIWSESNDSGEPLDSLYSADDLSSETLKAIKEDCEDFQQSHGGMFKDNEEQAGHDFCLTRNGHGAGFWDGDWPEHGKALTEACEPYGTMGLYVGDDGLVYHHG